MVDVRGLGYENERQMVEQKMQDDMPPWWQEHFGGGRRLDIPLTHSRQLRQVAEILRVLANNLERVSFYTEVPEQTILLEGASHIHAARKALRELNAKKPVDNVTRLKG